LDNNERRKEIINIKNVYKTYPNGVGALFDLNLSIYLGEFVFIIGGSGSGKSTLIKMLYREEKPTRGEIILGGVNVGKLRNSKVYKLRRLIGVVFQDYKLLPKLTVYENVAFALDVTGVDSKTIRKRVLDVLDKVGLKHKAKEYPDKLSGGEQQRVAIARAVVNRPKILICDEPTGNLDPTISMEIMEILEKINEEYKTTILMVTHDIDIVKKMKKRVIVIKDGRLIKDYKEGQFVNEKL
jgi:cell division transport system ATP-binding protein